MKMNIFKMLQKSRKSGLLSDNINLSLVLLLVGGAFAVAVILFMRVSSYDSSLPLRYSTLEGYYDQGRWLRPYVAIIFASFLAALHIVIASLMWKQKNYHTTKALLIVPLAFMAALIFIAFNIVTGTTL